MISFLPCIEYTIDDRIVHSSTHGHPVEEQVEVGFKGTVLCRVRDKERWEHVIKLIRKPTNHKDDYYQSKHFYYLKRYKSNKVKK